ncbi:hypothetical protein [Paraburkholderia kururiensis]|uniref:hypothetical protein n=1 Tax=Paraburkholderia kururiensis TaxID=984307 RepID=UPI0018F43986|nr:hypothetical protein [Paraburkholderia kururiensis]
MTVALLDVWLTWSCIVDPGDMAHAVLALVAASHAQSSSATAFAARLQSIATLLANIFVMMLLVLTGARSAFGDPLLVTEAFRADLQRLGRLVVGTPASGEAAYRRLPARAPLRSGA